MGAHVCEVEEVEARLVGVFPRSLTRAEVYAQWRRRRQEIVKHVAITREWVDGSFVTLKRDPGDIDVVTFIEAEVWDRLPIETKRVVAGMFTHNPRPAEFHLCDAYLIAAVAPEHPNRSAYLRRKAYWRDLWSVARSGGPKGFLEVRGKA